MSLLDRTEHDIEGWRPEPNDGVEGVITFVGERQGDYEPYPYLEIDVSNAVKKDLVGKTVAVHAFHTVLKREIADKQPRRGDQIAIRYLGLVKSKSLNSKGQQTEFEKYRVEHVPSEKTNVAAPDWDQIKQDAESEVPMDVLQDAFPGAETFDDTEEF